MRQNTNFTRWVKHWCKRWWANFFFDWWWRLHSFSTWKWNESINRSTIIKGLAMIGSIFVGDTLNNLWQIQATMGTCSRQRNYHNWWYRGESQCWPSTSLYETCLSFYCSYYERGCWFGHGLRSGRRESSTFDADERTTEAGERVNAINKDVNSMCYLLCNKLCCCNKIYLSKSGKQSFNPIHTRNIIKKKAE